MSTTGPNPINTGPPNNEPTPLPVYVKRRERLADKVRGLSRKHRRRVLDISQTYWAVEQDDIHPLEYRQHLLGLAKKFGNFSLAYSSAAQPCLEYFEHPDIEGYIAFRRRWGVTFALGDPLVAAHEKRALLDAFCKQEAAVSFCQISAETATHLNEIGFRVNEMGVDTNIDLQTYNFTGKEKEWLRYADNWIRRRDYEVKECLHGEVSAEAIETVSEAWRGTRTVKRKEVRFLNRPIVVEVPEPEVRKFYFFAPDGRMLAFVYLDPVYYAEKVIGYVTSFKRRHPDAPQYSEQAMMKRVIEQLSSEGLQVLKLGLSPGAWIEDQQFRSSWFTSKLLKLGFQSKLINHYCYNLVGHANYKRRFRGREEKTFLASNSRLSPWRLMALFSLCGIA